MFYVGGFMLISPFDQDIQGRIVPIRFLDLTQRYPACKLCEVPATEMVAEVCGREQEVILYVLHLEVISDSWFNLKRYLDKLIRCRPVYIGLRFHITRFSKGFLFRNIGETRLTVYSGSLTQANINATL